MPSELNPPKVFISYSHDSQEHFDRVLLLSDTLREWGIDCHIDQYELAPADWVRWMESRIRKVRSLDQLKALAHQALTVPKLSSLKF